MRGGERGLSGTCVACVLGKSMVHLVGRTRLACWLNSFGSVMETSNSLQCISS